jgi:hypothetical protein
VSEFYSRYGNETVLYSITFRLALGPTRPPNQWVLGGGGGGVTQGLKQPVRENDHSTSSKVEVKDDGVIPPLIHTSLWRDD